MSRALAENPIGNPRYTQLVYWLPDGKPWQEEYFLDEDVEAKLREIEKAGGKNLTPSPQGLEARRAGRR
jgi:hypothetical protein